MKVKRLRCFQSSQLCKAYLIWFLILNVNKLHFIAGNILQLSRHNIFSKNIRIILKDKILIRFIGRFNTINKIYRKYLVSQVI